MVWVSRQKFILRVSKKLFDLKIELFDSSCALVDWINLGNTPLLSLSAKNNQERLEHKIFTKNPDFSRCVRQ
jgi:hypothetical protein